MLFRSTIRQQVAVIFAFAMLAGAAGVAEAQAGRPHIGPHVAYNFDVEEFAVGAQFTAPLGRQLEFYPSFDYYFVEDGSLWAINTDLKLRAAGANLNWLYVGGGLNITRRSVGDFDETDTGLNLIAGLESMAGRVHPFGEFRTTIGDGSSTQLAFGLNFTLGTR